MGRLTGSKFKTIMFTGPRKIEFQDATSTPLKADEVRIKTIYSGISRGTEMTVYRGTSPLYKKFYDPEIKLFLKSDQVTFTYPLEFGYENIGRIVDAGPDVKGYGVGDIVFTPMPHTEYINLSTTEPSVFFGDLVPILKIPQQIKPEAGVFAPLLGVAYNTILDGRLILGENVAIFGAGVIGLLTTQLCRLAGAEQIYVVDPLPSRRELAKKFGATHLFDPNCGEDISKTIRDLTGGRGADLTIELSGAYGGLQEAIRSVGYNGRVVVGSFLAKGEPLELGEEFHHNRIRLISSQSFGVAPDISDRWNPARRMLTVMKLLSKLKLEVMITNRFKFSEAAEAFALVDEHPQDVLQIILEYE